MRVISIKKLKEFWEKHPDSEIHLRAWKECVEHTTWEKPCDVLDSFNTADSLKNKRVVFNICHNKYRMIVKIEYKIGLVFVRFIGTHNEYDKINAETV